MMDQFAKQNHKSALRVRRKNRTANQMLHGQLKYIEKDYFRDYRQYLRDKIKLQTELRELEEVPSNSYDRSPSESHFNHQLRQLINGRHIARQTRGKFLPFRESETQITPGPQQRPNTKTSKRDVDAMATKISESLSNGSENRQISSSENLSRSATDITDGVSPRQTYSSLSVASQLQPASTTSQPYPSELEDSFLTDKDKEYTDSCNTSCRKGHSLSARTDGRTSNRNPSPTHSTCRYTPDPSQRLGCHHFPCVTPITYHTLGLRRNDLTPWTSDIYKAGVALSECDDRQWEVPQQGTPQAQQQISLPDTSFDLSYFSLDELRAEQAANSQTPRWSKGPNRPGFHFKPINGPLFSPRPPDPILEKVRNGIKSVFMPQNRARANVEDRLRGLRNLVTEMRTKIDHTRPLDRAVNYGRRLPAKAILNPAVPVKL